MRRTRFVVAMFAAAPLLGACGSVEYRDTNAAVDANPLCASRPSQPGEPVARECERTTSGSWSSRGEPQPVDFRPRRDD